VFAAGTLTNQMTIEVTWRSGRQSLIQKVKANRIYEIEEAGANAVQGPKSKVQSVSTGNEAGEGRLVAMMEKSSQSSTLNPQPLFEDVSHLLGHMHAEEPFDDFA